MSHLRMRVVWPAMIVALIGTACQQPERPAQVSAEKPQQPAPPPSRAPTAEPQTPAPKVTPVAPEPRPVEPKPLPQQPLPPPPSPPPPPVAQPAAAQPPVKAEKADEEARRLAEIARLLAERMPKRPTPSWVIFREAFEESEDATCRADWTGENRLEVHTENIQRLTLDLTRLPAGAPGRGPWNLQIDHQGIQITGLRGKVLDLVRSKNGNWTVDHSKGK
jgi:hypothetical protein